MPSISGTSIKRIMLLLACIAFRVMVQAQHYSLGEGLVILADKSPGMSVPRVPLYEDSNCTRMLLELSPEQTNCPSCMACAEPQDYYQGTIHPFLCSAFSGVAFVCHHTGSRSFGLFTDTNGSVAYLPRQYGAYYTWDAFMKKQAGNGEYFTFHHQWDHTVLYDKPYPLNTLPEPDANDFVHVHFKDLDELNFYPVKVAGYWMQLRAVRQRKTVGHCWIIWRDEKQWLKSFRFRPE